MTTVRKLVLVSISLLALIVPNRIQAQTTDVVFFTETGHTVRGDFLKFYNNVKDPTLVFGYPITELMVSVDGNTVQYFSRARFELHTDSTGKPGVYLTPIVKALYEPGGTPQPAQNPSGCQQFSTGHSVCLEFLQFYRDNGGPNIFGKPISPVENRGNVLMQHFENARFEWRVIGSQGRVTIADLGRSYFDKVGEAKANLAPVNPPSNTINPVLSIKARAFVLKASTRASDQQTVYVIVRSQTDQLLANASGTATATLPDGTKKNFAFTTDQRGIARFTFDFQNQKTGEIVPIEIVVTYQKLTTTTKTSFRIWY